MILKDPPTLKDVLKIFIVGLALRSYAVTSDSNGQERRTSIGHEFARRVQLAANRMVIAKHYRFVKNRRLMWCMTPERLKDYDAKNKQRAAEQKRELTQSVQEFVTKVNPNVK
ncbi:uncharacterized protein LOC115629535 [Scaptodrosophila lebanonensis]|uniref:Uncharacterized protein LOC115629535 n=1 Tax=Drosophila lebanonensis TaxID=7225 RepID=A0A6J2U0J3_DROLE|nr:uncharacterized protein LOC115629535 [Scaptodrosophila lebanonensis]